MSSLTESDFQEKFRAMAEHLYKLASIQVERETAPVVEELDPSCVNDFILILHNQNQRESHDS